MKVTKVIKRKEEQGITLIALVVTIVVLLILAGVTITFVLSDGGILQKAREAANKTNNAIANEQGDIDKLPGDIENLVNSGSGSGGTNELSPLKQAIKDGTIFEKTTKITDDNKDEMWVPQDFKIVEGESIETGVVIEDGVGNQFVWVPVPDINAMYDSEHQTGKLYNFSGSGANLNSSPINYSSGDYREPDILTGTASGDATTGDPAKGIEQLKSIVKVSTTAKQGSSKTAENDIVLENWADELRSNFDKMIASVTYYKGFYIGRYETGNLKDGEVTRAVVKQVQTGKSNANWYCIYASSKDIAYKNETDKITSVTSSMIWGCQWDATLNWFIRERTAEIENENEVNKIWDMSKNVCEWTLECYGSIHRIFRGGKSMNYHYMSGPAWTRCFDVLVEICDGHSEIGSRAAMYLNK